MRMFIKSIFARLRAWWASQFMPEPEAIYHILPHPETNQPLPHNEENYDWQSPTCTTTDTLQ